VFFVESVPAMLEGWALVGEVPLSQMIWTSSAVPGEATAAPIVHLGIDDVDQMLALTGLTKPGPFGRRTHELGTYLGIRDGNRLVAMAGERLRLPGFTEVSAVCTHPDFVGRGYARTLVSAVVNGILGRGERPFLHVARENVRAARVYEGMGFTVRKFFTVIVLGREAPAPSASPETTKVK
jgi:ribosomal protein S18 acetylase RimI-like enzyme